MKNITVALMLFLCCKSEAQDPNLFSNTWYLQKVIINEIDYDFPFGGGTAEINFTDTTFNLHHPVCEEGFPTNIQYSGNNTFINENGGNALVGNCEFPTAVYFQRHYRIYVEDDGYTAKNPFSYIVTTNGDQSTLVVTNVDGDQAIYGDQQLVTDSFLKSGFSIFPNPVQEVLKFSGREESETFDVKVYDVLGKEVLYVTSTKVNGELDVRQLSKGIYVLEAQFKTGEIATKKFVKI